MLHFVMNNAYFQKHKCMVSNVQCDANVSFRPIQHCCLLHRMCNHFLLYFHTIGLHLSSLRILFLIVQFYH